jgi:hypothetical protein
VLYPIQKSGFLPKVKEIKRLSGGLVCYAPQASAQTNAEIWKINHLWLETGYELWKIACSNL